MTQFILDFRIKENTFLIKELPLSNLYLQNESRFPWVVLVPRVNGVSELIDLSDEYLAQLNREIVVVSKTMRELFLPDKLNVANIGNVVPQLHIHIVARYRNDAAWPKPIWGVFAEANVYDLKNKDKTIKMIAEKIVL